MKVIHKSIGKLIIVSTLILTIGGSFANAENILLNFTVYDRDDPTVAAAGWQSVWYQYQEGTNSIQFNLGDLEQTFITEIGSQTFKLQGGSNNSIGAYINTAVPVINAITKEGFYFNVNQLRPFSLSGFTEGDQISVYAISAWGGNGKAGTVTIGSETTQALAVDFTGGLPTIDNFTLINNTPFTVGADGLLSGFFNYDTVTAGEGDIGGLILVVTPVPEPSTWLLLAGGVSLLAVLRRRCR